jgi:hypothetical protein
MNNGIQLFIPEVQLAILENNFITDTGSFIKSVVQYF